MTNESLQTNDKLLNFLDIIPHGFKKIEDLGKIADLRVGINSGSCKAVNSRFNELKYFYLVTHKNILLNGSLDIENISTFQYQLIETSNLDKNFIDSFLLQPNDILISKILTKTNVSIALVSDISQKLIAYTDSVIRVRVNPTHADPVSVFEFLRSDSGLNTLKNYASSLAGMPRISLSGLAKTPVFIPDIKEGKRVDELNSITVAVQIIKDDILPVLETVESIKDKSNNKQQNLRNSQLSEVALKLHKLASTLVPPPLAERVMNSYPTPIALAYRRFHDSRFNVYEQVQRLQDIFELTSYFIYNLVLSDILQRLDPKHFYIKDSGARNAYNTFAMSRRIDFIKEVVKVAKPNRGVDLFIPELVSSSFTEQAEKLKDLRNHLSHTATTSESGQRKILNEYKPIVENLLSELEFLIDYRLVRIPSSYRKHGQTIYRMEVYQGVVPHLKEQKNDLELEELQLAEHDHLVMLNNVGKVLDLYPLYQIVDNEKTQYENHMCFLKQCKTKDKLLEGESIQNSVILCLEGFNDFEKMKKRILEKLD